MGDTVSKIANNVISLSDITTVRSMSSFETIRVIGQHDTFDMIYLVRHVYDTTGMVYVVRKVNKNQLIVKKREELIFREATSIKEINHENLVKVHAFFLEPLEHEPGYFHMVMEHCKGKTLQEAVDEKKDVFFGEEQVCHWMVQIAMALKWLHDRTILHREIKSDNIFLTGEDKQTVKLGYFGFPRILEDTSASAFDAKSIHLPLETIIGEDYNFKSEIWSLGVIAYQLTTLKLPYEGTGFQIAEAIQRKQLSPISDIYTLRLRILIEKKMLACYAGERATIAQVMEDPALQHCVSEYLKEKARTAEVKAINDKLEEAKCKIARLELKLDETTRKLDEMGKK